MFLELTKRGGFDQAWLDETHKLLCLKRWGQPADIGNAAVYLATAAYVTGEQSNASAGLGVQAPPGRAASARTAAHPLDPAGRRRRRAPARRSCPQLRQRTRGGQKLAPAPEH